MIWIRIEKLTMRWFVEIHFVNGEEKHSAHATLRGALGEVTKAIENAETKREE
jgi:hypothetical protein